MTWLSAIWFLSAPAVNAALPADANEIVPLSEREIEAVANEIADQAMEDLSNRGAGARGTASILGWLKVRSDDGFSSLYVSEPKERSLPFYGQTAENTTIKRAQAKADAFFLKRLETHWGVVLPEAPSDRKKLLDEMKSAEWGVHSSLLRSGRVTTDVPFLYQLMSEAKSRLSKAFGEKSAEARRINQLMSQLEAIQLAISKDSSWQGLASAAQSVDEIREDFAALIELDEFDKGLNGLDVSKAFRQMDRGPLVEKQNQVDHFFKIQGKSLVRCEVEKLLKKSLNKTSGSELLGFFEAWHLFAMTASSTDLRWSIQMEFSETKQSGNVSWITAKVKVGLPRAFRRALPSQGADESVGFFGFQMASDKELGLARNPGAVDGARRAVTSAVSELMASHPTLKRLLKDGKDSESFRKSLCAKLFD